MPVADQRRKTAQLKQRQTRLNEADQALAIVAYRTSGSINVVAREFGINRRTAANILERHSLDRYYNVLTAEHIREAATLYRDGWSLAKLGQHLGVDAGTVRRALRKAGVTMRPVGTNQWTGG
ncbi:MAG: hypothetical protein JWN39_3167 [Ilumatobacteraceae bacterium]|nr:hypothetical protein [Ilumatobacteraceae bacterium]